MSALTLNAMFALLGSLLRLFVSPANLRDIALENLALRQQLAVFKRKCPRPRVRRTDRFFWFGCPGVGRIGTERWLSSGQRPSWPGIARAFASSGACRYQKLDRAKKKIRPGDLMLPVRQPACPTPVLVGGPRVPIRRSQHCARGCLTSTKVRGQRKGDQNHRKGMPLQAARRS